MKKLLIELKDIEEAVLFFDKVMPLYLHSIQKPNLIHDSHYIEMCQKHISKLIRGNTNSSGIDFVVFQINGITGHGRNGFLFEITKK